MHSLAAKRRPFNYAGANLFGGVTPSLQQGRGWTARAVSPQAEGGATAPGGGEAAGNPAVVALQRFGKFAAGGP